MFLAATDILNIIFESNSAKKLNPPDIYKQPG
jgi:hypothetical protein